jgi:hypothetical protein
MLVGGSVFVVCERMWDITRISRMSDYGTRPKGCCTAEKDESWIRRLDEERKECLPGGATTSLIYQTPEVSIRRELAWQPGDGA